MTFTRLSMRSIQTLAIVGMGVLGIVFAFFSSEVYRNLALDTQRDTLSGHLRIETQRKQDEFNLRGAILVERARSDPAFVKAATAGRVPVLVQKLDALLQSANSGTSDIRIARLYLLNDKYRIVAASSNGAFMLNDRSCLQPVLNAESAPPSSRSAHRLCLVGGKPFYLDAVALGSGDLYLYFGADMTAALTAIEFALGSPLQLRRSDGPVTYVSANWPKAKDMKARVVATHTFPVFAPKLGTWQLSLAKDMAGFYEQASKLRYLVLTTVFVLTAIAVLVTIFALEHAAFKPWRALTTQFRRVRADKSLDQALDVRGDTEVTELAEGINEMTGRLREMYVDLEHQAFTDALTELPNRNLFQDRLQQTILSAKRDAKSFALFFMDLDRFKDVNDTLGHRMGDLMLKQVAQRLRTKMRASDTVARMGGDEFAVLLPVADAKHASMAARMLLRALQTPFAIEQHNLSVSASIGIVLFPDHGQDVAMLMQRADVAMYAAKNHGEGFVFYDATLDQNYPARLMLLSDLRQAVEHEQFELYYQPIVNLADNKVTGVEALARWRHPREGLLTPDSFIPVLEQSGLIHNLMPWIVSEALKRAHAFKLAGLPLTVSVNISMRDLQDRHVAETFAEQLEAHEVNAASISLEITESAVMTDIERTLTLLSRLSDMGLKIAVDDFGTGYSSLSYLKQLPVNTLKVDKSFVTGMGSSDNDAVIVRTSIELAHNLGLKVVAEGVENELTLERLRKLSCDMAQGNYIAEPMTSAELDQWLTQSVWSSGHVVMTPPELRRQAPG